MKEATSAWLIRYGFLVIVLGIAAVIYHPVNGFGFNPAAKSGLIAGGICGVMAVIWGALARGGARWPLVAAIVTSLLFGVAFAMRMIKAWSGFAAGDTTKWYAASLITAMFVVTVALLTLLIRRGSFRGNDHG